MNVSNNTIVLPNYRVLSINQIMIQVSSIIFPSIFLAFDTILLLSTIESRRDSSIPYAYLMVMSLRGVLANFILLLQPCVYLIATLPGYFEFTELMGREATLLGNFSYLVALVINVLMSVNRVAVVMKPMNTWFDNTRVFIYCGIIAILMLISLLIPYFSPCDINFDMTRLAFISGCAPGRHPVRF
ncbi:hypothetical protein B9Z55_025729 [Caenorhabditis nigoni]|uniref:G-protein coupled receptors family 1 profile domain-containing protein n=1 Tax=Caenorhabditis nigoni TaxID=1611254 RepID=A0A2G5SZY8_9PELO|nr:hypothetical protein B9Z55_025729 [Caenorhabditis nigoni]